jgi:integrase
MIFLLLSGMRFGETRKLKWCHVDFENKILVVPREITKSDREHRLPLSDFLVELLKKRYTYRRQSEWVFQSCRLKEKHLGGGVGIVRRVRAKSGIHFTFHDLRRTFLTMGEKLDVPTYALKRLVNHSASNDMTGRYLILDIERLRSHMSRITEAFLALLDIKGSDMREWKPARETELVEITQLRIPLNDVRII